MPLDGVNREDGNANDQFQLRESTQVAPLHVILSRRNAVVLLVLLDDDVLAPHAQVHACETLLDCDQTFSCNVFRTYHDGQATEKNSQCDAVAFDLALL